MEITFENCPFWVNREWDFYVLTHTNSNELCGICHLNEKKEHNQRWNRYELSCGHKFHTRCLRKWISIKKKN